MPDRTSSIAERILAATYTGREAKFFENETTNEGTQYEFTPDGLRDYIENTAGIPDSVQVVLNSKAPIDSPTFTGTVGGITKSMVGLGNVDNTSDVNKPISTATQTALDDKLDADETSLPFATNGIQYVRALDSGGNSINASAYMPQPITNFGATSGATATTTTTALNLAVAACKKLYIPAGAWRFNAVTGSSRVIWYIDPDATFPDLPTKGPFGQKDLSNLGGRISWQANANITFQGLRYGDPDPWPEEYREYSVAISEFVSVSPTGEIAICGWSRASDHPTVNQGTIGGEFGAVNDDITYTKPVFGLYVEAWRTASTVGAALGQENEAINLGDVVDLSPINDRGGINAKDTISYVAASGGEITGAVAASAAFAMWANGTTFRFGFVCRKDSLDPTGDLAAFSMPNTYDVAWYSALGGKIAYERAGSGSRMTQSDTASTGYTQFIYRRLADNSSNTRSLDTIFRQNFYGYVSSANYLGGWIQLLQRGTFSGGNARFSLDMAAKNTDGTESQITLNGLTNKSFDPYPTNDIGLGSTSGYWSHITSGYLRIVDGITAPSTLSGYALIYVDTADGDLKIKFGDGTVKTIVVDT